MQATASPMNADLRPPKLGHSVAELGRVVAEFGWSVLLNPVLRNVPRGDGHTIIVIPGFMGADGSTSRLRKFLREAGYNAIPWELGRNASEVRASSLEDFISHRGEVEDRVAQQAEQEFLRSGRKVTLIGWSLGGLYSVGVAHRFPHWIRRVVTLGTPYGDPRGTALYSVMGRLYNQQVDVDEAMLKSWVDYTYRGGDLRVPVLALFSESDGVVGAGIARCEADPEYVTNMAVLASHVGFPFNPVVFAVIGNHLVERQRRWGICRSASVKSLARVV
ncbi:MAG: alpha/beta hydrolase [Pseudomonadota bacterium]